MVVNGISFGVMQPWSVRFSEALPVRRKRRSCLNYSQQQAFAAQRLYKQILFSRSAICVY